MLFLCRLWFVSVADQNVPASLQLATIFSRTLSRKRSLAGVQHIYSVVFVFVLFNQDYQAGKLLQDETA